jgi:hypothetical protein
MIPTRSWTQVTHTVDLISLRWVQEITNCLFQSPGPLLYVFALLILTGISTANRIISLITLECYQAMSYESLLVA